MKKLFCGKGLLYYLKSAKPITEIIKLKNNKVVVNDNVRPEDILILVDGTKTRGMVPKAVSNGYYKNNEELDFKSVYSIKGIIIHANTVEEAINEYKEIKSNLLEN